jgi:Lon protease-like protein
MSGRIPDASANCNGPDRAARPADGRVGIEVRAVSRFADGRVGIEVRAVSRFADGRVGIELRAVSRFADGRVCVATLHRFQ